MTGSSPNPDGMAELLRRRVRSDGLEMPAGGTSMAGSIEPGSRLQLSGAERARIGEIWAAVSDEGTVIVHRVRRITPNGVVMRGSGNEVDDHPLPIRRLIGRVIAGSAPDGRMRTYGPVDRWRAAAGFRLRSTARRLLDGGR